ncbi:hypothetical protein B2A_14727, partial [mine drainage metagenome]
LFVTDPDVDPTNNRAERSLMPSVMYRKTSGGTRSDSGDRVYETLASVSYTSKLRKGNIMADGPPEIRKWMDKKRKKKMEERLNRSGEMSGSEQ